MSDEYDELLRLARSVFMIGADWEQSSAALADLRQAAETSFEAREELVKLIYHPDGMVRIMAAEALARVHTAPQEAIPVLCAVLDVYTDMGYPDDREDYARVALGALGHYDHEAVVAEEIVWRYLHCQKNLNLRMYAAQVVVNIAAASTASWTIMSLLCDHQQDALREFCREIVREKYPTQSETREAPASSECLGESVESKLEDLPDTEHHLEVSKKELTNALKQIVKFKRAAGKAELMMLSLVDGLLRFSMASVSVGVPATGVWDTDVLAPAFSIYLLARVPLKTDPVVITVIDGKLRIGSSVIPVQWGGTT